MTNNPASVLISNAKSFQGQRAISNHRLPRLETRGETKAILHAQRVALPSRTEGTMNTNMKMTQLVTWAMLLQRTWRARRERSLSKGWRLSRVDIRYLLGVSSL